MNPLVSVIVPVYNVLPYLKESLDSLIGQTYQDLEIILIDDGSTDDSGKLCDEYANHDKRILVIHQENKGLSAARNIGLDKANGEYIAFLDSDDAFHICFIEKLLSSIISKDADIALCKFSDYYSTKIMDLYSPNKSYPSIDSGVYDRTTVINSLINSKINVNVWNKLYKKSLWENIRFYESHVYEDVDIAYQICSQIDTICVIHETLYKHRIRTGSITKDYSYSNIDDAFQSVIRTESFISDNVPALFTKEMQLCFRKKQLRPFFVITACQIKLPECPSTSTDPNSGSKL